MKQITNIICIIPTSASDKALPYLNKCITSMKLSAKNRVKLTIYIVSSDSNIRKKLMSKSVHNYCLASGSIGFSKMNNVAIEESLRFYESDYYLLINDDAWVKHDFFEKFYQSISHLPGDIYCPLINNSTGSIQSFGIEYFPSGYAINNTFMNIRSEIVPGACVFIKTKMLTKLKRKYGFIFNPLLYSYYEDIELSIRAHAIGAKIIKLPDVKAFHIGSNSYGPYSKTVMYHSYRNIVWVIWMTWPIKIIMKNFGYILLVQIWFIFCSIRDRNWFIYPRIIFQTIKNFGQLNKLRDNIIKKYQPNFNFDKLFSPYWFRLRKSGFGLKRQNIFRGLNKL